MNLSQNNFEVEKLIDEFRTKNASELLYFSDEECGAGEPVFCVECRDLGMFFFSSCARFST